MSSLRRVAFGLLVAIILVFMLPFSQADDPPPPPDGIFTPRSNDYQANERTYLAWIRSALTMTAIGLGAAKLAG